MAMSMISILCRRSAVSLSSIIFNHHTPSLSVFSPAHLSQSSSPNPNPNPNPSVPHLLRAFRSTNISFARPRQNELHIGPEDVLFAGCDYNHWLITMDFPQDPPLSPQDMVQAYVHTAASVLGSVEEAMKTIYACSTTTYTGFQLEVSEDVAKMFQGLPGVVFILPDSYIDPVNKQYGGDKYDNGIITRRPAPGQYGRQGGMFGDRNRDFNRPSRPRGESQQRHLAFDDLGPTGVSAGNFGPPRQKHGPPRVAPVNISAGNQENYQGSYIQSQRGDSYLQGQRMPLGGFHYNAPQQGVNWQGAGGSYEQAADDSYGQGASGGHAQGAGGQGSGGSYGQGVIRNHGQGSGGNIGHVSNGNFGPGASSNYRQGVGSNYGQGTTDSYEQGTSGSYGQGAAGSYGQGTVGDVPGQEKFPSYGHNNPVHGGSQRF